MGNMEKLRGKPPTHVKNGMKEVRGTPEGVGLVPDIWSSGQVSGKKQCVQEA